MARLGKYFYIAAVSGFDPDAQAFFDRVTTAGGTLTTTEKNATNQLVLDMKSAGIWTSMKAVYPMVGASAAACAQNLKSSSFTGTFTSGWTFASTGVTGNGTSSYMNTNFQPSSLLDGGNWFLYINNNGSNQGFSRDFGYGNYVDREVGLAVSYSGSSYGLHGLYSPQQYNIFSNNPFVLGFYQSNQYNGNNSSFLNNSKIVTRSQSFTYANYNMYLGAELNINTNNAESPSDRRYAFAGISDGLNDTQSSNFYTAVQAFQTTLNRYVDAPWYNNGNLLLDIYPSAAAAYSVRKLRNNYIGGPIRVRRSSDNAEQDIYFDANGNLDTTSLTTFCSGTNGFVTTWYDQSGNGNNATQSTAANQPQIVSSGSIILENSKPAIQFDGSNDTLLTTISYNINSVYVEKVERFRATTAGQMSTNFDASKGPYFQWISTANKFENYYDGLQTQTTATTTRKLYSFYASLGFYENGALTVSRTGVVNTTATTINIGSYSSGIHAQVNIQEFVFYTSSQISNRTGIESEINSYYAIY